LAAPHLKGSDMDWTTILAPIVVEHVAPLVLTVAGGAVAVVVAKVGGVAKRRLNVDIDAELNTLLHAAIERAIAGLIARGTSRSSLVHDAVAAVKRTNPDALERFGLDHNPGLLAGLVQRAVDAKVGATRDGP